MWRRRFDGSSPRTGVGWRREKQNLLGSSPATNATPIRFFLGNAPASCTDNGGRGVHQPAPGQAGRHPSMFALWDVPFLTLRYAPDRQSRANRGRQPKARLGPRRVALGQTHLPANHDRGHSRRGPAASRAAEQTAGRHLCLLRCPGPKRDHDASPVPSVVPHGFLASQAEIPTGSGGSIPQSTLTHALELDRPRLAEGVEPYISRLCLACSDNPATWSALLD